MGLKSSLVIGLAILKGDFFIDIPTLRSSCNYVGVRIYQGIWMIKRSEMRAMQNRGQK